MLSNKKNRNWLFALPCLIASIFVTGGVIAILNGKSDEGMSIILIGLLPTTMAMYGIAGHE